MKPVHVWLLAAVTKPRWAHDWRNYCLHVKKNHLIPLIIKLLYTKALQVSRIYLQKSSCCFIKHHYLYFFSSDIPVHFGLLAGAKLPFALTQELGAHLRELSLPSLGSEHCSVPWEKSQLSCSQNCTQLCPKNTIRAEKKPHSFYFICAHCYLDSFELKRLSKQILYLIMLSTKRRKKYRFYYSAFFFTPDTLLSSPVLRCQKKEKAFSLEIWSI